MSTCKDKFQSQAMLGFSTSLLDNLKAWLANRVTQAEDTVDVMAPDPIRAVGFADLKLERAGPEHQETIMSCHDFNSQRPTPWSELSHLTQWAANFAASLANNKSCLTTLEMIRANKEHPISQARFSVDESVNLVQAAVRFDVGLDIQHPDTRGQNYAVNNILFEDSTCLHDLMRQIIATLFSRCAVRLVVKSTSYYTALMAAFVVDLMHISGATLNEVRCLAFDRRESIGNENFSKPIAPNRSVKLSVIAAVFRQTDTFSAAQGIIESYFREQYPNLIVLVEEANYERFIQDWQRYYSHALHIGTRLDDRTAVVDTFNSQVQIDLAAIDIRASHKMAGSAINVLKFRTLSDLQSLLAHLRKVPCMSIWNDDYLFAREFCLRLNICKVFWMNHMPKSVAGRNLPEDMIKFYHQSVAEDMTDLYNSIYPQYTEEVEQLKKVQTNILKMHVQVRTNLIIQAYISVITKCKSLRNGSTVSEAAIRLKRFSQFYSQQTWSMEGGDSRIETFYQPVGLAIILVREEGSIKSKSVLLEFVFKNLLIGNAVLLVCPSNTLGARFEMAHDHVVPFKMVNEGFPDISRLSLDASIEVNELNSLKKKCPKNVFAIEMLPDLTSESCETITIALGTRRKSMWYSDVDQANYWLNE